MNIQPSSEQIKSSIAGGYISYLSFTRKEVVDDLQYTASSYLASLYADLSGNDYGQEYDIEFEELQAFSPEKVIKEALDQGIIEASHHDNSCARFRDTLELHHEEFVNLYESGDFDSQFKILEMESAFRLGYLNYLLQEKKDAMVGLMPEKKNMIDWLTDKAAKYVAECVFYGYDKRFVSDECDRRLSIMKELSPETVIRMAVERGVLDLCAFEAVIKQYHTEFLEVHENQLKAIKSALTNGFIDKVNTAARPEEWEDINDIALEFLAKEYTSFDKHSAIQYYHDEIKAFIEINKYSNINDNIHQAVKRGILHSPYIKFKALLSEKAKIFNYEQNLSPPPPSKKKLA